MVAMKIIAQLGHYGGTYFRRYDFSIVSQWRCHDLISGLMSPNKEILDMYPVIVHGLTPDAKFQKYRSKTVVPSKGQNLTCITSIDLIW